jgi:hypothetical protein
MQQTEQHLTQTKNKIISGVFQNSEALDSVGFNIIDTAINY